MKKKDIKGLVLAAATVTVLVSVPGTTLAQMDVTVTVEKTDEKSKGPKPDVWCIYDF